MTSISHLILFAGLDQDGAGDLRNVCIILGIVVLVIGWQIAGLVRFYRIPPPGHAIVRQGREGCKVVIGSGIHVIPVLHVFEQFPLGPFRTDLRESKLDGEQAKSWQLPNTFQVAIGRDREMILRAAQGMSSLTRLFFEDMIVGEYERLLAQDGDVPSQDSPVNRFIDGVEQALNTAGLVMIACRRQ